MKQKIYRAVNIKPAYFFLSDDTITEELDKAHQTLCEEYALEEDVSLVALHLYPQMDHGLAIYEITLRDRDDGAVVKSG